MALVLFESRVNMITAATPSIGGFLVAYDTLDGVLKQKDHLGVITPIGFGNGIGSLAQTLSIGNNTGDSSIYMDSDTTLRSTSSDSYLKLDSGGANYVELSSAGSAGSTLVLTDSTVSLSSNSFFYSISTLLNMDNTEIGLSFGSSKFSLKSSSSYLKLGTTNVLEFTSATSSRAIGNRRPGFISSSGSSFSSLVYNSVIIGGSGIIGTQSNSVYTPNLIVKNGGYIKGTEGIGQLKFNNIDEAYLSGTGSTTIGILKSGSSIISNYNGIFITDNQNSFSTSNLGTSSLIFISSKQAVVSSSLSNTIVIGGQGLIIDSSNTVYLGGEVDINNNYKLPITDGTSGQFIRTDGFGNLSWSSGIGTPVITLTALEFSVLTSFSSSSTYKITDADIDLYGGTEIYLTTNSQGLLNDVGEGKFYNPKYDQTTGGYKIWSSTSSYLAGSIAYWGGRAWSNNIGTNALAAIDIFNLNSSEWTLISYTSGLHYTITYDGIKYDRSNDKIIYRNEKNSNIVSTNKSNIDYWVNLSLYNPIKVFQWGNLHNLTSDKGIGSQNIINSYNENINFRGVFQVNITMNNSSGQYNLNTSGSQGILSSQNNLSFDNYLYNRQLILLPIESNLVFQGNLPRQNSSTLIGKLNNQQVEIDLTVTALVTPVIRSRWDIYKSDGITPFGATSINGVTIGSFTTSNFVTVPSGCIVNYTGTSSIPAATTGYSTPTTRLGSYTFSGSIYPLVSATLSTTNLSSTTSYNTTITKPKSGLIVSGTQVIMATGSDSTSTTAQITFSNLFYYGYLNIGPVSSNISQVEVDGVTASQIEGLGNYRFGGKAQTFISDDGNAGSRLVFSYPSSFGVLTSLVYTGSTVNSVGAFTKATNPLIITTISGITASYHIYVANADNTWGNGSTITITTT